MAGTKTPWWDPFGWWQDVTAAASAPGELVTAAKSGATSWLTSAAGDLASGLEGGLVAVFGDIWDVIVGPIEIIIGVVLAIVVIGWAMKNQLIQIAPMVAGMIGGAA